MAWFRIEGEGLQEPSQSHGIVNRGEECGNSKIEADLIGFLVRVRVRISEAKPNPNIPTFPKVLNWPFMEHSVSC